MTCKCAIQQICISQGLNQWNSTQWALIQMEGNSTNNEKAYKK